MEDVAEDEVVDKEELEELEKRTEVLDDEAARNARFNFGYSIQVTTPQWEILTIFGS